MTPSQSAFVAQTKLLARYGSLYGLDQGVLDRIAAGAATEAELAAFTAAADVLIERFKSDMRATEPEAYTDADLEIIVAIAATNYAFFSARREPFTKIITRDGVDRQLAGAPTVGGFTALHRHTEHLSPAQAISQLGLDYSYEAGGQSITPYMVDDGGTARAQPFLYYVQAPMSDELRAAAKVPMDPRILQRVEAMAADPARDPAIRDMAGMLARPDVCCVIARNGGTDVTALMEGYAARGYDVQKKSLDAPYAGTSMPQYGGMVDGRDAYVDLVQEMSLTRPTVCQAGAALYLKVPRPNAPADPSLPHGSIDVEVAAWNGRSWDIVATEAQLRDAEARALASVSEGARTTLQQRLVTHDQLVAARVAGATRPRLDVALPGPVKDAVARRERRIQRRLSTPGADPGPDKRPKSARKRRAPAVAWRRDGIDRRAKPGTGPRHPGGR